MTTDRTPPPDAGGYLASAAGSARRWQRLKAAMRMLLSPQGSFLALVAFAFVLDLRRVIASAIIVDGSLSFVGSFGRIEYLTLTEWIFILTLAFKTDFSTAKPPRLAERAIWFALAFVAIAFANAQSYNLVMAASLLVAVRLAVTQQFWRLSGCLALVALQWAPLKSALAWLNQIFITIDAWAAHAILWACDLASDVQVPFLHLHSASHTIHINRGCDSLVAIAPVICAFGIFVLAAGKRLDASLIPRSFVLALAVAAINWSRLSLMTLSRGDYLYWHHGFGMSMIALVYAALAFVFAETVPRAA